MIGLESIVEPIITTGNIISVAVLLVSITFYAAMLKSSLNVVNVQLAALAEETKKIALVVTEQAVQNSRLNSFDQRALAEGRRIDQLQKEFSDLIRLYGITKLNPRVDD